GQSEFEDFLKIQNAMISGEKGFGSYEIDGEKMSISYTPIPNTEWSLGCAIPEDEIMNPINGLKNFMIALTVIFLAIALILIFVISASITRPLKKITKVTDELAKGKLDTDINITKRGDEIGKLAGSVNELVSRLKGYIGYINEISTLLCELGKGNLDLQFKLSYDGEFSQLKDAFVDTTKMLNSIITQLNDTAQNVTFGAEQVSNGSQNLAQGATEQASSIEELSATINEITVQVKKTAESSKLAKEISLKSCDAVDLGQSRMLQMISAMNEISDTSNKIEKIIKNIEDIAFQTNIL
ncbi:MAG: methyl-accepting chemotaxis protein, partial [Oscillospiraceae bacterium]